MKNQATETKSLVIFLVLGAIAFALPACSRGNQVYPDPSPISAVTPISSEMHTRLPKDFYNQSVNQASTEIQPDGASAESKSIRFQTVAFTNPTGGFNGSGTGNRAILGIGSWHGRPVSQAEPVTFDSKKFTGNDSITVSLQIDLNCDGNGNTIHVVNGVATESALTPTAADGFTRFTVSTSSKSWLSPTSPILDAESARILVPASGPPATLTALLSKYPAACLKNAATSAIDLPKGIPTAAVLFALGSDSTTAVNGTFVRRFTIGSEVYEGLQ